jgi:hypothetical protein
MLWSTGAQSDWRIYGNVWHDAMEPTTGPSPSVARILETQDTANGPIYLYNNTFADIWQGVMDVSPGSWTAGCIAENNVFLNTPADDATGIFSNDHNLVTTNSAIFPNYTNNNFNIVGTVGAGFPRDAGVALAPTYSIDAGGNAQALDGAWDIGANVYGTAGSAAPPAVTLTTPTAGATVSSNVVLAATATSNLGIASLAFLVDGVAVGTNTSSPYTFAWNSGSVTNGSHAVSARAQDLAGHQATSTNVTVIVKN